MKIYHCAKKEKQQIDINSLNLNCGWAWVDLPIGMHEEIKSIQEQIDPDDLFVEEQDEGLELHHHVTLKYGLFCEKPEEIKNAIKKYEPDFGTAKLLKASLFENEEYDVVKLSVESDSLNKLHNLLNALPHNDGFLDYKPHCTLAYVKAGLGHKYDGKFEINTKFEFSEIFFENYLEEKFEIKL